MRVSKEKGSAHNRLVKKPSLSRLELLQASKELIRFLEEFPEQTVLKESEIVNWYIEVLSQEGFKEVREIFLKTCISRYPNLISSIKTVKEV